MIVYLLIARRLGAFETLCDAPLRAARAGCCGSAPALTLAFIYVPLLVIVLYAFNERRDPDVADPGLHARVVRQGDRQPGRARRAVDVAQGGARRDARSRCARHARGDRGLALPLLRPRDDLVPRHPADRAAGHRHRHGAQRDVPRGARAVRHRARAVHGHRRPRDVLHRRRLQQRRRAAAADVGARSRRRRPTSARDRGRRSATSRSRRCARRCSPARCWRSRCRSTR